MDNTTVNQDITREYYYMITVSGSRWVPVRGGFVLDGKNYIEQLSERETVAWLFRQQKNDLKGRKQCEQQQ